MLISIALFFPGDTRQICDLTTAECLIIDNQLMYLIRYSQNMPLMFY